MTREQRGGGPGRRRNISARGIRRDPPDVRALSKALISLALAQAKVEAEAQAQSIRRTGSLVDSSPEVLTDTNADLSDVDETGDVDVA